MICTHAYMCDKRNDISICNLKEFECIQNPRVLEQLRLFSKCVKIVGFKIQESENFVSENLES